MKMFYPQFVLTNFKDSDKYYFNISLCIVSETRNRGWEKLEGRMQKH